MPLVSVGHDALHEDSVWRILARFKLVSHHSHFRKEILPSDETVAQSICLHGDSPIEVFFRSRKRFVVIGSIEVGRSVHVEHATLLELLVDIAVCRRSLEQHVFEQVRHARFAVPLMS